MDGSHYSHDLPARSELPHGSDALTGFVLTAIIILVTAAVLLLAIWGDTELLAPTLDAASLFLG